MDLLKFGSLAHFNPFIWKNSFALPVLADSDGGTEPLGTTKINSKYYIGV